MGFGALHPQFLGARTATEAIPDTPVTDDAPDHAPTVTHHRHFIRCLCRRLAVHLITFLPRDAL